MAGYTNPRGDFPFKTTWLKPGLARTFALRSKVQSQDTSPTIKTVLIEWFFPAYIPDPPDPEPETIKNFGIFRRYLYPDLEEEEIILALWTLI